MLLSLLRKDIIRNFSRLSSVSAALKPTEYRNFTVSNINEVAVIKIDCQNSSANILNQETLKELVRVLEATFMDRNVYSMVFLSNKEKSFIAGADINLIKGVKTAEEGATIAKYLQAVYQTMSESPKPIVSAINGVCLGGGLEFVLATDYRIAVQSPNTLLGFPEVQLGILPAAGGCTRLPRRVSLIDSVDLITSGRRVNAYKAKKIGLVDEILDPLGPGDKSNFEKTLDYLQNIAVDIARSLADREQRGLSKGTKKTEGWFETITKYYLPPYLRTKVNDYFYEKIITPKILKVTKGKYPAPFLAMESIRQATEVGFDEGLETEAKSFGVLAVSREARSLMHIFSSRNDCRKNPYGEPSRSVSDIGVVGAGLMGGGITQVSVESGLNCSVFDMSPAAINSAQNKIEAALDNKMSKKRISLVDKGLILDRITPALTLADFKNAQLVVEAVAEKMEVKHMVLKEIESVVGEKCILATNTSALSVEKVAAACKKPERVVGMHYFSPVDKMELLEIVYHPGTSKEALAIACDVGLRQGKTLITVKDSPGFYTTRIIISALSECFDLIGSGVEPDRVNKVTLKSGWPQGFVALSDLIGLDVAYLAYSTVASAFPHLSSSTAAELLSSMVNEGYLGKKVNKGFYTYSKAGKPDAMNSFAVKAIKKYHDGNRSSLSDDDISLRILLRMMNEAHRCYEEGIITSTTEGDVGAVFGIGFPPFMGGPFSAVNYLGKDKIKECMERFEATVGSSFVPCKSFADSYH